MKSVLQSLLFATFFFLTGCVTLYKPNAIHSPLLKDKGDLNTSASIGISGCGLYNLQAAYAPTEHMGIMMDGMYHYRSINSADSSVERLNIFFGEAGAGYFTTFGTEKKLLFQCYSGAGFGSTKDRMENTSQFNPEVNAKYNNVFFQPGIGYTNKNIEMAFDIRANYVHVYDIHAYMYEEFEWWNTDYNFYSDTTLDFVNLEPAFTLKAGGKKLKGVFQVGLTIPTVNSRSYFMVNASSLLGYPLIKLSFGISYAFGKIADRQQNIILDK